MKVGVIGAGTMGSGIAQAFAQTEGYEVMLCDINETFAANGKNKIAKGFEKRIAKGKMSQEDADKILAKITTGVKDICGDCDLIVEAAIENMRSRSRPSESWTRSASRNVSSLPIPLPCPSQRSEQALTAMWWECISLTRLR